MGLFSFYSPTAGACFRIAEVVYSQAAAFSAAVLRLRDVGSKLG